MISLGNFLADGAPGIPGWVSLIAVRELSKNFWYVPEILQVPDHWHPGRGERLLKF